jgi:hypothetical protein
VSEATAWWLVGGSSSTWRRGSGLHDWERAAARHAVLQQRIGGAELATPVEKAVGRHGGERGWRERREEEGEREHEVEREVQ